MIKDILGFIGGAMGMIVKVLVIIALCVCGLYCFGTMFAFPFIWEGLIRLAIAAGCGLVVFLILRLGRDRDGDMPSEDDFRP